MKIVIIAAMRKELELILSHIPVHTERSLGDFEVYEGMLGNHSVLVSQCGIGKVNSALRTLQIINDFNPDLVINSGVAGGADASMRIGSVLMADRVAYHDVWCGPGTEYGEADNCPLYFTPYASAVDFMKDYAKSHDGDIRLGLICSGDKFISKPEEVAEIKSHFPDALACDMESASIAQTCFKKKVPFVVVRVMSDMPGGGENISEYTNFWSEAPGKTFAVVSDLIASL